MKLLTTASSYQKYSEAHLQCETEGFRSTILQLW